MFFNKRKRKRIKTPRRFKAGDVFWAPIGRDHHLTIILDDHTLDNHQECIPICNFTATPNDGLNYVIPIGGYPLPAHWWTRRNQAKPENWIVCQPKDCIKAKNCNAEHVIGNIKDDCSELFDTICEATRNCLIAPRLEGLCDCEGSDEDIIIDDDQCECENIP